MRQAEGTCAKKPYQPPKLFVYGDLTEMTRTSGMTGNPDGGSGKGSMSHTGA